MYRTTEDARYPIESALGAQVGVVAMDESGAQQVLFQGLVVKVSIDPLDPILEAAGARRQSLGEWFFTMA